MNSTALDFHGHYEQKDGRRSSLADRRANANRCRFHGRLEQLETRLVLSFTAVGSFGDGKAAWVDFNQDGWTDLASGGTLYRNNNGTLTSFTSSSGDGVWGDYDNDGYPDLYSYSNRGFMRNNKGMNLISGANMPGPPAGAVGWGRGATFGDFNGGGFLDLYRMEDMDLATDCFTQRLTHGRNIKDIPTLLPSMSLLPSTDAKR